MKVYELACILENIRHEYGDVYVSVQHTAGHDFSPTDDLTNITKVKYNKKTNLATICVSN